MVRNWKTLFLWNSVQFYHQLKTHHKFPKLKGPCGWYCHASHCLFLVRNNSLDSVANQPSHLIKHANEGCHLIMYHSRYPIFSILCSVEVWSLYWMNDKYKTFHFISISVEDSTSCLEHWVTTKHLALQFLNKSL